MDNKEIKRSLFKKLIEEKAFWSYDMDSQESVPDDVLIAETLIHLDIEEINLLFKIFGKQKVKQVWLDQLVVQDDYYKELNRLYAWFYFDIKNPERYLKSMLTRHYNRLSKL